MKPKSLSRPSELVLSAIYNLNEENGSSVQDIVDYISGNYCISTEEIKQKVEAALKRGLSFGLISKDTCGLYKLRDIIQLPDVPSPQRVRRKRKRQTRLKKKENAESTHAKVDETKKRSGIDSSCERFKRAKLDLGERSRNCGVKLDSNIGCTNLSCRRK